MTFRRFPDSNTRQLIDFNRFLSLTGEKVLVCLDKGVMEVLRYFLNSRARWQTTYYTSVSDEGYLTPTGEQMNFLWEQLAEANIDMSNCTELVEILTSIRDVLAAGAAGAGTGCGECGGGSRGAGASEAAPNPFFDNGTDFPPGFSSRSEFDEHRCNKAYDIVDNLIADLQGLTGINYAVTSNIPELVSILVTVLLTPIPYDDIAYLVALLLFTAVSYTFLVEFSSDVFDNRDNLACILYNSADAGQAQLAFRAELDALIIMQSWPDTAKSFVSDVVVHLTPFDAINLLYSNVPTVSSGSDCSACGPQPLWQVEPVGAVFPVVISGNLATQGVVESGYADIFGAFRNFITVATTNHPGNRYIEVVSIPEGYAAGTVTAEIYVSDVLDEAFNNVSLASLVGLARTCSSFHIRGDIPNVDDVFQAEFNFVEP